MAEVDVGASAVVALATASKLIEGLVRKQVLTEAEGFEVYQGAVNAIGEPHKGDAIAALQGLMSGLKVQRT